MPRETSKDVKDIVTLSVASVLGIKGPVRFAHHGLNQKPHVILKRVVVSEDESDDGRPTHVVRFSLFAAKRIECKPGKEILLSVESNEFDGHPIVIEGDERDGTEEDEEAPAAPKPKKEPTPPPIAMPPKMRKAWMRSKMDEPQVPAEIPPQKLTNHQEIGVQAQPEYLSASAQAMPIYNSLPIQVQPIHKSTNSQTDPIILPKDVDAPPARFSQPVATTPKTQTSENTQQPIIVIEDRSPSPMELESPIQTPEFSPTLVPGIIDHIVLSPSPAPQLGPSLLQTINPESNKPPPTAYRPIVKEEPREEELPWPSQSIPTKPREEITLPSTAKPTPSRKPTVKNPFVSAGYVTDFVGIKSNGDEKEPAQKQKVPQKTRTPVPSTSKAPPPPATKPASPRKPSRFDQPARPIRVKQEEAAPVSLDFRFEPTEPIPAQKSIYDRPTQASAAKAVPPKGPRAMLIQERNNSRPASPATPGPSRPETPPPAPKEIACITNGPSLNPLGIRPSTAPRVTKVVPTGSKALIPPSVSKKRVVIGPNWGQKQANGSVPTVNGTTPHPVSKHLPPGYEKSATIKSEPMDNTVPPLPLEPSVPAPTPKSKWKRITSDNTPTVSVKVPNPVETPRPAAVEPAVAKTVSLKLAKTPAITGDWMVLPGIERASSSSSSSRAPTPQQSVVGPSKPPKDKVSSIPTTLPPALATLPPTPATLPPTPSVLPPGCRTMQTMNGRLKRERERERLAQAQKLPPIDTSTRSSPNTSASSAITPTIPSLNHPLPPRPDMVADTTRRGVKREREASPELFTRRQRRRRDFPFPTLHSNFVTVLTGRGDTAVRRILFSKDGDTFACHCADETIRIWSSKQRMETSKINPKVPIVAFAWMDDDGVFLGLDEDGLLGRWIRRGPPGNYHWDWIKVFHAGRERPSGEGQVCLTYMRGRIAVSYPKDGVSMWVWQRGHWQKQRSILRQNVTALKFVEDGGALIGGTQDGVLWRCEIPNGTLRAYAFLRTRINSLDMDPTGSQVLAAQVGGFARLVSIKRSDQQGMVEKSYSYKVAESRSGNGLGAFHVNQGDKVMFGSTESCVLLWDQQDAKVFCGLEHDEGEIIEAAAAFEGPNNEGYIITGTKSGCLAWWPQPVVASAFDR